jgi:hypothetical protein
VAVRGRAGLLVGRAGCGLRRGWCCAELGLVGAVAQGLGSAPPSRGRGSGTGPAARQCGHRVSPPAGRPPARRPPGRCGQQSAHLGGAKEATGAFSAQRRDCISYRSGQLRASQMIHGSYAEQPSHPGSSSVLWPGPHAVKCRNGLPPGDGYVSRLPGSEQQGIGCCTLVKDLRSSREAQRLARKCS